MATQRIYMHGDERMRIWRRPGFLLVGSFALLIGLGTALLLLVPGVTPAHRPGLTVVDAFFTMTSAVCVTGLIVVDTAADLTPRGQAIVLAFVQLGGLGILIFAGVVVSLVRSRLSVRGNVTLAEAMDDLPLSRVQSMIRFVVLTTLAIELAGAVMLFATMPSEAGAGLGRRAWVSVFHSVSAFCNAGFALHSDSLASQRYSFSTQGVMTVLIVAGGLGFPVLSDLWRWAGHALGRRLAHWRGVVYGRPGLISATRLNLHTKLALAATGVLYVYGVVFIAGSQLMPHVYAQTNQGVTAHVVERDALDAAELAEAVADGSFMSLTARTAGFNSVPMDQLHAGSVFALMTLMFIGASPGGTGGGLKTVTAAVLLLTVAATVRQRSETEAFSRTIGEQLVRKAATLGVAYVGLIGVGIGLLSLSEPFTFGQIVFEVVSAASTTGLSLGITPELSAFGKCVIMAMMFLGRVGTLALLGVLVFRPGDRAKYSYPQEEVLLG